MSNSGTARVMDGRLQGRSLVLAACMAASFMAAVEATIMATAMPAVASSLDGFGLFAWVFSAYMLGQAATIPLYGRLADMFGRRNVFFAGVLLFLIGSTLCGFARSMTQLVIFRAIQGLGAGGVQPIANTIVGDIYTPVERARIQGLLSGVFGVSAIIGPSLGAFIVRHGDWPLVFWMNLPIGAVAIVMIALFLPEEIARRQRRPDFLGAALLMVTTAALMLLLLHGTSFSAAGVALLLAVLIASGGALVANERRVKEPLLPVELWRNPIIAGSSIGSLVTGILMMGVIVFLPTYIQGVMGKGPHVTAFILALMSVVWVLGSAAAGLLLPRSSYADIATAGALALIMGAAIMITMTPSSGTLWACAGATLIGIGMGFCNTTFMVSAQTSVLWHQRGAATSSTMFLRFLGQALGASAFGAVLNISLTDENVMASQPLDLIMTATARANLTHGELESLIDAVSIAMRNAYLLTGMMAVLALMVALTYPGQLGPANQTK